MSALIRTRMMLLGGCLGFALAGAPLGQVSAQTLELDREIATSATAGCAAQVSPPAPNSRAAADSLKVLPPAQGAYVGAYQIPAQAGEAARFANAMGRMPPIVFSFHDFFSDTNRGKTPDRTFASRMEGGSGSVPPLELARWLDERGSVLALAWAVYCCDYNAPGFWLRLKRPHTHINRILAGEHDDFIRQSARQIRAYGRPIMLTVVPEMNWQGHFLFGDNGRKWLDAVDNICNQYGDPSWPDGPERVRDVFIRVIDIFRQEGVKNVTWFMYSANDYMRANFEGQSRWLHPQYYYPGDAYIDWVGQSTYFTKPEWVGNYEDSGTFEDVFLPGYQAWQSVTRRPMLLAEFGIVSEPGADRSDLWQDLLRRKFKTVPGVKAFTIADSQLFRDYFQIPMLSTSVQELNAFRAIAGQDPYYRSALRLGRP